MAIGTPTSVKTGSSASGTSLALTTLAAVSTGNLLIVSLRLSASGAVSISDTKSNVYVQQADSGLASGVRCVVLSVASAVALVSGDTITITYPSGTCIASVDQCNTGWSSTAVDQTATATGTSNAPSTGATGTRSDASELLWSAVAYGGGSAATAGTGIAWTLLDSVAVGTGGAATRLSNEYFIASATGTDAGTFAISSGTPSWAAAIVTFKVGVTTSTRVVPQTASLRSTLTRTVPQSASLRATLSRAVPQSASLRATRTRVVPQTATLGAGVTTSTRVVPQSASLRATRSRTVPQSASLFASRSRVVPQSASFRATLSRVVHQSASLGWSAAAIDAALHAAARTLDFRYERYDPNGNLLGSLTTVLSASVAYDALANIKRTAKFTLIDDGSVNVLSDRVKPYVRLLMPDGTWSEWALGLFLLSTPPRSQADNAIELSIDAYDLLQLVTDDEVTTRYTVASGTKYTDAVVTLLNSSGLTNQAVTASTLVLPAVMDWPPGTAKLKIINDLLAAINYLSLWFDGSGRAIVAPYVEPDLRTATYTYQDDALSVVLPTASEQRDLFAIPNEVIATVSEPDQSVLTSTATNTNAGSPASTVSRGRTIVQVLTGQQAPDQTTLDAITKRALTDAASIYEEISFETAIMPFHSNLDALQVTYSPLGLNAVYIEHSWSFALKAGSTMKHNARKAVSVA